MAVILEHRIITCHNLQDVSGHHMNVYLEDLSPRATAILISTVTVTPEILPECKGLCIRIKRTKQLLVTSYFYCLARGALNDLHIHNSALREKKKL